MGGSNHCSAYEVKFNRSLFNHLKMQAASTLVRSSSMVACIFVGLVVGVSQYSRYSYFPSLSEQGASV